MYVSGRKNLGGTNQNKQTRPARARGPGIRTNGGERSARMQCTRPRASRRHARLHSAGPRPRSAANRVSRTEAWGPTARADGHEESTGEERSRTGRWRHAGFPASLVSISGVRQSSRRACCGDSLQLTQDASASIDRLSRPSDARSFIRLARPASQDLRLEGGHCRHASVDKSDRRMPAVARLNYKGKTQGEKKRSGKTKEKEDPKSETASLLLRSLPINTFLLTIPLPSEYQTTTHHTSAASAALTTLRQNPEKSPTSPP
ncbi:hypothetical protein EJB05_12217, partial [Eragrostis curvula]